MMKLAEIYDRLQKWDISDVHLSSTKESNGRIRIENLIKFKVFAEDIAAIPAFTEPVQRLKHTALYYSSADQITVNRDIFYKIYKLHTKLFAYVEALKKTIGENLETTSSRRIFIKLSDPSNLEEMLENLKTIQTKLSDVLVNDWVKGDVKTESWDIAEGKVSISIASHEAMELVGSISSAAVQICWKMREGRFISNYIQELKVNDESVLDINNSQEKAIRDLVDEQAGIVLDEHFIGEQSEELYDKIRSAISQFAELLDGGTEIHPASNAPEKVRRLFPNLKNFTGSTWQIKPISEAA
jgi:hypothetical protein